MASLSHLDFDVDDFFPHLPDELCAVSDKLEYVNDIRPRFFDGITKSWMLLDSGAQVTVVPRQNFRGTLLYLKLAELCVSHFARVFKVREAQR